ncbi:unnamed protein product, partial [Effrenium voratum]
EPPVDARIAAPSSESESTASVKLAVEALSLKNGWRRETLLLSLLNNVAFLEHRATRLTPEAGQRLEELFEVPEIATSAETTDKDEDADNEKNEVCEAAEQIHKPTEPAQVDFGVWEAAVEQALAVADAHGRRPQDVILE